MKTIIYMVRHAESPFNEGTERTRGLTLKGREGAAKVTEILKEEGIHTIISSPYARAVLTLEGVATALGLEIQLMEDLRERHFSDGVVADEDFASAEQQMFDDPDYALPGGESNRVCQHRAVTVLKQIVEEHFGKKVAIGTHGHVMTLIMNEFDPSYGLHFMNQTTKPDIYQLQFDGLTLEKVRRLWQE
ncbi:2,3-bisphosphoglycerate-dependent phosphoglycerate mutase [Paenibacillus intestini]|uniref:Histidine phosphatase family protein n=1 Tax=Paenibacillus cucumis (ex Kampfer et al. 2016) TaxID=1776858 RepID=A0ABS7KE37_9BACL|nr:histidine phosphatase family protein [Paenibacillus cucumis (ex Kampfer et al. 2016)]MBY0202410.1 histidine phosphatase family protein [Paenibacillus cucumis (ex Kampfer et al. 2016)]MDP9701548.1 2,3-bisphosphoglycerate-dependent phosphoglycerate mutase [Paenibacillus intestini]